MQLPGDAPSGNAGDAAPPMDCCSSSGSFQIGEKIIPDLRISTAHFLKNCLCHCLFLPFIICISAPCALGLLSLLLHIFCLCNQIIDLLTAKDLPQEAEILQFGAQGFIFSFEPVVGCGQMFILSVEPSIGGVQPVIAVQRFIIVI